MLSSQQLHKNQCLLIPMDHWAKESSAEVHAKAWAWQLDGEHNVSPKNQPGRPFLQTRPLSAKGLESLQALGGLHEPIRLLVSKVHQALLCGFHEAQGHHPLMLAHYGCWQIS